MGQPRWFMRPYGGFLGAWLRLGKPVVSGISGWFAHKEPVDVNAPFVFSKLRQLNPPTLEALDDWLADHTEW